MTVFIFIFVMYSLIGLQLINRTVRVLKIGINMNWSNFIIIRIITIKSHFSNFWTFLIYKNKYSSFLLSWLSKKLTITHRKQWLWSLIYGISKKKVRNNIIKTQKNVFILQNFFSLIQLFSRLKHQFICIHNLARR